MTFEFTSSTGQSCQPAQCPMCNETIHTKTNDLYDIETCFDQTTYDAKLLELARNACLANKYCRTINPQNGEVVNSYHNDTTLRNDATAEELAAAMGIDPPANYVDNREIHRFRKNLEAMLDANPPGISTAVPGYTAPNMCTPPAYDVYDFRDASIKGALTDEHGWVSDCGTHVNELGTRYRMKSCISPHAHEGNIANGTVNHFDENGDKIDTNIDAFKKFFGASDNVPTGDYQKVYGTPLCVVSVSDLVQGPDKTVKCVGPSEDLYVELPDAQGRTERKLYRHCEKLLEQATIYCPGKIWKSV